MTILCTDHPSWIRGTRGVCRLLRNGPDGWLAVWMDGSGGHLEAISPCTAKRPQFQALDADQLPACAPRELLDVLRPLGTVAYLPNPSLWDAIAAAIMRMAVGPATARAGIHALTSARGPLCESPVGVLRALPDPATVLQLTGRDFADLGLTRNYPALHAAATAYLDHHPVWEKCAGPELVGALQRIPLVGSWTAAVAAADYTGDLSLRPVDQALREAVACAVPSLANHRLPAFSRLWTSWCPTQPECHALMLYVLTLAAREPAPSD